MNRFDNDAMGFLLRYVRGLRGRPFCAEEVTLAAREAGIAPPDLRNWGKVFNQAARDGYIARCDKPFRRVMGNGTWTLGWVAR